jgi:hypothetical protein
LAWEGAAVLGHDAAFVQDVFNIIWGHVVSHVSDHGVELIVWPFGDYVEGGLENVLHVFSF